LLPIRRPKSRNGGQSSRRPGSRRNEVGGTTVCKSRPAISF
jgi:hypothetical protein